MKGYAFWLVYLTQPIEKILQSEFTLSAIANSNSVQYHGQVTTSSVLQSLNVDASVSS